MTYPPWLSYENAAGLTWDDPPRRSGIIPPDVLDLIHYATLAPSGHNAQPWKFAVSGQSVRIMPDWSRRLPIIDPDNRELWISLGCACGNLLIAAAESGYRSEVVYPTALGEAITIKLMRSSAIRSPSLFAAIPFRQNTRSLYDGRIVSAVDFRTVDKLDMADGVGIHMVSSLRQKGAVIDCVAAGNARQYSDQRFDNELLQWLRFNKPEALRSLDGLYTRCSGRPEVPRWIGKHFVNRSSAAQQSDIDLRMLRSSSGLFVVTSVSDDIEAWIETGRAYERNAWRSRSRT